MDKQISTLQNLINTIIEFAVNYSFQVVGAVVVLIVGFIISNWVYGLIFGMSHQKNNLDVTLSKFLATFCKIVVIAFALIIAMGKFGITIAPFIAALGALSFGASFAIQGPLSNYGAGLSIILSRPFVVGDTITVAGVSGLVKEVKMACTILTNEDGVQITIPNKQIVGEILYNSKSNKVVEAVIGISYSNDPEIAIRLIANTLKQFSEVTSDPVPQIGIQEFADSSINISYRYWIPTDRYFHISYQVNLAVYKALQQASISIPFPQREVRVISASNGSPLSNKTNITV